VTCEHLHRPSTANRRPPNRRSRTRLPPTRQPRHRRRPYRRPAHRQTAGSAQQSRKHCENRIDLFGHVCARHIFSDGRGELICRSHFDGARSSDLKEPPTRASLERRALRNVEGDGLRCPGSLVSKLSVLRGLRAADLDQPYRSMPHAEVVMRQWSWGLCTHGPRR